VSKHDGQSQRTTPPDTKLAKFKTLCHPLGSIITHLNRAGKRVILKVYRTLEDQAMNEYNINPKHYDPRMHSAEHIFIQTMVRMFDCGRAFSSHIEKKKSKCDFHFSRNLTPEEIDEINHRVNEVIQADVPVTESFMSRHEANLRFNLSRLPEEAGDTVRIISIGGYDACPCSGVHAPSSGAIGSFKIVSTDFSNGVLRVRFTIQRQQP
jgi:misacylated tRNA(Ala) deacylase